MNNFNDSVCQNCGTTKKTIPAGVSKKTGRAYKAFKVCEVCPKQEKPQIGANNANLGASTAKFDELMRALGDIEAHLVEIDNKLDDISRATYDRTK